MSEAGLYPALVGAFFSGAAITLLLTGWHVRKLRRRLERASLAWAVEQPKTLHLLGRTFHRVGA